MWKRGPLWALMLLALAAGACGTEGVGGSEADSDSVDLTDSSVDPRGVTDSGSGISQGGDVEAGRLGDD